MLKGLLLSGDYWGLLISGPNLFDIFFWVWCDHSFIKFFLCFLISEKQIIYSWSFWFYFGVGLFTGCFVSLFSVYALLAHLSGIFSPSTELDYMETVYPVFRWMSSFTIAFLFSHMQLASSTISACAECRLRATLLL